MTKCPSCGKIATLSKDPVDLNDNDVKTKGHIFFCSEADCSLKNKNGNQTLEFRAKLTEGQLDKILLSHKRWKDAHPSPTRRLRHQNRFK
jgi:hypothetical protein